MYQPIYAEEIGKAGQFSASINGDCIDYSATRRAVSYVDCARFIRHLAKPGEVITIYGPKGDRRFKIDGPAMLLRRVN